MMILIGMAIVYRMVAASPSPLLPDIGVLLGLVAVAVSFGLAKRALYRSGAIRFRPVAEVVAAGAFFLAGYLPIFLIPLPFSLLATWRLLGKLPGKLFAYGFLPILGAAGFLIHDGRNSLMWVAVASVGVLLIAMSDEKDRVDRRKEEETKRSLDNRNALLSTLSHEIRTPLTVIQSSVDVMLEQRTGPLTDSQRNFLESAASNVRRLITLSENILASIKVESSWFNVNPVPLDIRKTVIRVAKQMEPILAEKSQTLKYSFPKWLPRPSGDETWIQQVLINLIHNSSKHLAHGGAILVNVIENELCIVVSVSDDGTGMTEKDRVRAFGEFFRGSDAAGREMDGFGLGLTIVQKVIEKHGGKVYVGSVEKLGTTVSFTLPKHEEPG